LYASLRASDAADLARKVGHFWSALKGHGFSRAANGRKEALALATEGWFFKLTHYPLAEALHERRHSTGRVHWCPEDSRKKMTQNRKFWVVSPNVGPSPNTKSKWVKAVIRLRSAFMGWKSNDKSYSAIGFKFAHLIRPGDVIFVARRYHGKPDLAGVGVVIGRFEGYRKSLNTPQEYGSRRRLRPFTSIPKVPRNIPIMSALGHTKALRQLHPERSEDQRRVCDWLLKLLSLREPTEHEKVHRPDVETIIRKLRLGTELEYKVQRHEGVAKAKRKEALLVIAYQNWLARQSRVLDLASYGRLRCDGYEKNRNNLIEAKQCAKREFIRMAAGQLLDYAYVGRKEFRKPNMAILLPNRPDQGNLGWLKEIGIHLIWREGRAFRDNCNGQFT
jgi:hypothetical protein